MTIREQISEMPGEKQIAWLLRLLITAAVAAGGTISWNALQRLEKIAEHQAAATVQFDRLAADIRQQTNQLDRLFELHYAHGERIRALELRMEWDRRQRQPPRDAEPEEPR